MAGFLERMLSSDKRIVAKLEKKGGRSLGFR